MNKGSGLGMYETFENLPESKRNHILQICTEEFSLNGYKNTSTNRIVKRLGISKGSLFLYFRDKKHLYLYLVDYAVKLFMNKFLEKFNDAKRKTLDVFEDLDWIKESYYNEIIQEDIYVVHFILGAIWDAPEELREEIAERRKLFRDIVWHVINKNNFRQDIDPEKAIDLLLLVSDYAKSIWAKKIKGKSDVFLLEFGDEFFELYKEYLKIIQYGICERKGT